MNKSAFSLFELMCVLLLIATLAALTWFSYQQISSRHQLNHSTQLIKSWLIEARFFAMQMKTHVFICPYATHDSCGDNWSEGVIIQTETGKILAKHIQENKLIQIYYRGSLGQNKKITFMANGATLGQQGRIYICSSHGANAILINASGYLKVENQAACS